MSIKQAIKTINEEIVRLERERSDLQASCKHPRYTIVNYEWRVAATYMTRYCTECNSTLGAPTYDEEREFIDGDPFKVYENIPDEDNCGKCFTCYKPDLASGEMLFIVCPECGNKRCPKANHHNNECTNSNDAGQKGSAYE